MRNILQINFLFIIFTHVSIFISSCGGLFPLGSDVHIKCPLPAMESQSISHTSIFSKNNVKKIIYKDSIYLVISDFSHYNRESFSCPSQTEPTAHEIVNPSSSNEVTKFRVVGGSLVLFCTYAVGNTIKWKWTSFLGKTGSINIMKSVPYMSEHFLKRVHYSNSIYQENDVTISPVAFEDAGKYQLSHYRKTINLITIQVMAFPSPKVHIGSTVQLTCLISHLLADMGISLIWIKYSGYVSIDVKTQILNLTYMENKILIEDIKMEEITIWACLVFNKDHLVASAPIALESDITNNYDATTTTTITTSRTMFMAVTDSLYEDLPDELQIGHFLLIGCICIALLTLTVFFIFRREKTLGGKNMEARTNVPLSADLQYASVKFYKRRAEPQETSVINQNQDSDYEVVYSAIQLNE